MTESAGKAPTGHAVGGVGWYRATFDLPEGQWHELRFDGCYMNTDVWVNGRHVLRHPYGYTPFTVPLGPGVNEVALRVANEGHNSRWYSGSGLYREVELVSGIGLKIPAGGVFVATPEVSEDYARIAVVVEAHNPGSTTIQDQLQIELEHLSAQVPVSIEPGQTETYAFELRLENPKLWQPWDALEVGDEPHLYTLRVRAGATEERVAFGVRTVELDAKNGLHVNGRRTWLKGGCVHHDNGILGACAYRDAEWRKVRLLKECGFNAIRTSHNPPSRHLLDACDVLGLLVIDEVHDEWETPKCPDSYHKDFPAYAEMDAIAMVRRDRNHPSVWCWSIGNEIPGCYERPDIAARLREAVRRADATRPITAGLCHPWWDSQEKQKQWSWERDFDIACESLDVVGVNYQPAKFRTDHDRVPSRLMMGTESYPLAAWEHWTAMLECPYVIGDFVWTAQDYIGESGIGQRHRSASEPMNGDFPYHLAVCGDLDLLGRRKPQSYYREALWRSGVLYATVHIPAAEDRAEIESGWHKNWGWDDVRTSWTWPGQEGKSLTVDVYASVPEVEILLNGRSLAKRSLDPDHRNRVSFQVPYEAGELRVVGGDHSFVLLTEGEPVDVAAALDRCEQLDFILLSLLDAAGEATAKDLRLSVTLEGEAELLAFGNASPVDVESVQDASHRTHEGYAMAVVRRFGAYVLIVSAEGVPERAFEF